MTSSFSSVSLLLFGPNVFPQRFGNGVGSTVRAVSGFVAFDLLRSWLRHLGFDGDPTRLHLLRYLLPEIDDE
jgi:hypothetical protein